MWQKYQGALLWHSLPHLTPPTETDARQALQTQGGWFARWTSDFDCGHETAWWYCICDRFTSIEELTAKQRYRVNKGLRALRIVRAQEEKSLNKEAVLQLVRESFEDYPKAYRPVIEKESFIRHLDELMNDPKQDIWLAYTNENELVGYGACILEADVVWLNQVKVPTRYLSLEVNAALVYTLSEYYLKEHAYRYICDGERNIKHQTNYQDFLVRVLNFRYAYCRLNIVYQGWMNVIVSILYPFRSLIAKIGKHSPFVYNIYCVLFQEEIRRSFHK